MSCSIRFNGASYMHAMWRGKSPVKDSAACGGVILKALENISTYLVT